MDVIPHKYILIFDDSNNNNSYYLKLIKEQYHLEIVKFLLNHEIKTHDDKIIEIYPDQHIEDIIIKNSLFVIYFSNIYRSKNLINILKEFNKFIIFQKDKLEDNLQFFFNNNEKNNIVKDSIINFEIYSESLFKNKINTSNKNIKIAYTKVNKLYESNNINMITYFKKDSQNNIINILQKKCIIENSKNKFIKNIVVLGHNLNNEFNENDMLNNIILHNLDANIHNLSFKTIFEIAYKYYNYKIICIIRSDTVLPNQTNLQDMELDILTSKNDLYCLSRIDHLINGTHARSEKNVKVLNSCEQDAWILKLPIDINLDKFENIYFYDKYSELYVNYIFNFYGYNLINDALKYKILRLMYDNNINNRLLINDVHKIEENNIYLLPEYSLIENISIEQLIQSFNLNNTQLYSLKCYLFNKYLKNKIIKHL